MREVRKGNQERSQEALERHSMGLGWLGSSGPDISGLVIRHSLFQKHPLKQLRANHGDSWVWMGAMRHQGQSGQAGQIGRGSWQLKSYHPRTKWALLAAWSQLGAH